MILCSEIAAYEGLPGRLVPLFHVDLKCTRSQFSLSVFECCLGLLILSGGAEQESGESSFILMSQVLDLLKSEY